MIANRDQEHPGWRGPDEIKQPGAPARPPPIDPPAAYLVTRFLICVLDLGELAERADIDLIVAGAVYFAIKPRERARPAGA